jgi:hypothetical protein
VRRIFRKPRQAGFWFPIGTGLQLKQFNNPASTKNMTTLLVRKSIGRSPLRLAFLLIPLALAWFALSPTARAVSPAPDGAYDNGNTAEGAFALLSLTTGVGNSANGDGALLNNTTGNYNTANGVQALFSNTTGSSNTANGVEALNYNTTGGNNIALGFGAGLNLTTGNNNIGIGNFNPGTSTSSDVAAEANTIRIGNPAVHTATFIAGISGVTVPVAAPVVIDANGQLGTASPASLQGPAGPQGPKGDTGVAGPQGLTGPPGTTGAQGSTGATGPQGAQGIQGLQGPAGTNGTNGAGLVSGSLLFLAQGITPPSGYTFIAATTFPTGGTKKHPTYITANIYRKN